MAEVQSESITKCPLATYIFDHCRKLPAGEIRVKPSNTVFPSVFMQYAAQIRDMEVRPDDTWVITYPKCGTTWTQEMVWLLSNNCDFATARKVKLPDRFPFLEFVALGIPISSTVDQVNSMASPRLIKSHLPFELLPKQLWTVKPKIIYVYRDPRDAAVSYYHHFKLWYDYTGTYEKYMEAFLQELLPYDPFWDHVLRFWEIRNEPNVCFNTFEDMKRDLGGMVDRTSKFLGVQISSETRTKLIDHLSFDSMKENRSVNYQDDNNTCKDKELRFMREGKSGGWKNRLSTEQALAFDVWTRSYLKNSDFPYYQPSS